MENLNKIAPYQNVSEIITNNCLNPNEPFHFGIEFLDKYFDEISKYSYADFRQIEMVGLRNFAMLLSYGGLEDILAFNTLDISPSGSGKSFNHDLQKELILSPMIAELDEKEKQKEIDKTSNKKMPQVYKCYHNGTSTSSQFFLRCASQTPVQMIFFDEFGRALKNSNAKNIIDFCIENWSKNILTAPSEHKNYLHGKAQNIKCKIFCAMNTSLAYLGKKAYIDELAGGLLNRPINYCAKEVIDKDYVLELEDGVKTKIIEQSKKILEFATSFNNIKLVKNQIDTHQITKQYNILIKEYRDSYKNIYREYFARVKYNYKAILITLHYLREFDFYTNHPDYIPSVRIDNECFEKAYYFMLNYIENFEVIVNELEDKAKLKDGRLDKILRKVKEFEDSKKLPIPFSKLGAFIRPKLKADDIKNLIIRYVVSKDSSIIRLNDAGNKKINNA